MEKLRQKIIQFINSPKDAPVIAAFVIGFYLLTYYYSKNFSLANSWIQLLFFSAYYIIIPLFILFTGYSVFARVAKGKFKKHFLFISIPVLFSFYILQLSWLGEWKRPIFAAVIIIFGLLTLKWARFYKVFVLLIAFMSLFNLIPILQVGYIVATSSDSWKEQPDNIEHAVFKHKPNIYYIQPDGYASFANLQDNNYNFDNSAFEGFLKENGFTLYNDFRSNYFSTLLSNSSMFSMKHHYIPEDINTYAAREVIVGENAVIKTLKNNGYRTHFITDRPYMVMNRPKLGYDYCNIEYSSIPFIKDGWEDVRNVGADFKDAFEPEKGRNFYFIERMLPSHICSLEVYSLGAEEERKSYLQRLQEANEWLRNEIKFITAKDPQGIIIIAADHGGFVGFEYTLQSEYNVDNPVLVKSVFGAMAAIKWNNPEHTAYDGQLKTSVNLFRTVFSYLAEDKKYLDNLQKDDSYIKMLKPSGLYKRIDDNGKVVMEKRG
ncbi:alkaline phosphatase family protein [Flavobacterium rhizosphaerae]|uniref:Sulfatase N-terminal domain-containing protein n=1 Tax=Flavobacterium rhizosphaerae TaxID=3163298 RepID=A0ABW8Z2I8_9FLAO